MNQNQCSKSNCKLKLFQLLLSPAETVSDCDDALSSRPPLLALAEMDRIDRGIRLPLTWFSENFHERLRAAMQQAGIL